MTKEELLKTNQEYQFINAEQALKELDEVKELYTREEVYQIAERNVHAVINGFLTDNCKSITQIINSEIDTVKLF